MVTYQFDIDDGLWNRWKNTVPRDKSLDTRIRELIEADADGRVRCPSEGEALREISGRGEASVETPTHDPADDEIERAIELGSQSWEDRPEKLEARRAAARAVLEAIREGPKSKDELLDLRDRYPVEEQGERTWWRNNIKAEKADHPGPIDIVAEFSRSSNKYEWTGLDEEQES